MIESNTGLLNRKPHYPIVIRGTAVKGPKMEKRKTVDGSYQVDDRFLLVQTSAEG